MYRAAVIVITISIPMVKGIEILKVVLSITIAFDSLFESGFNRAKSTISATQARKTIVILFIKGMAGAAYFNTAEKGILKSVAANAPLELDRFQKNPIRNIARIPGEMKPVNSWM